MPETNTNFWRLRARLWPTEFDRSAALGPPITGAIDDVVARILRDLNVNTATCDRMGYRGLADDEPMIALQALVGEGFRPFKEVRRFWLPTAASAASFYEKRRDAQPSTRFLSEALRRFETEVTKLARRPLPEHSWSASPFRPYSPDPIELRVPVDDLLEEIQDQQSAFQRLKRTLDKRSEKYAHANLNVWDHTFVDILGIAWFRLTKRALRGGDALFRDFVTAAWEEVFEDPRADRADRAIRAARSGGKFNDFGAFLETTEDFWEHTLRESSFPEKKRKDISHAIFCAYTDPHERRRFWKELRPDGSPDTGDPFVGEIISPTKG